MSDPPDPPRACPLAHRIRADRISILVPRTEYLLAAEARRRANRAFKASIRAAFVVPGIPRWRRLREAYHRFLAAKVKAEEAKETLDMEEVALLKLSMEHSEVECSCALGLPPDNETYWASRVATGAVA